MQWTKTQFRKATEKISSCKTLGEQVDCAPSTTPVASAKGRGAVRKGGPCIFRKNAMSIRTIVYVDAFNLYYGALKDTPYKWLDLLALSRAMLRRDNVVESIKYFTAKVVPRPSDPSAPTRQNLYLRALRTIKADVVLGRFLSHPVRMMLSHPQPGASPFVEVIKTEEKGSDVNIASQRHGCVSEVFAGAVFDGSHSGGIANFFGSLKGGGSVIVCRARRAVGLVGDGSVKQC